MAANVCVRERGRIDLCLDLRWSRRRWREFGFVRLAQTGALKGAVWHEARGRSFPHPSPRDLSGI